jgi:lipopolysaccharide/colanic/teichoic acid biosynthesis glycosyltransferase
MELEPYGMRDGSPEGEVAGEPRVRLPRVDRGFVRATPGVPRRPLPALSSGRDVDGLAEQLVALEDELAVVPDAEPLLVRAVRRGFDIVVSATALVLLSPVILASALVVRLDSPGPAFFRQARLGRGGKPFRILKLRGMYIDAKERFPQLYDYRYSTAEARDLQFHMTNDPRVTRAGRIFRTTSIDELMNFWNVLVGDMSLVGPRPQIPEMFEYYGPYEQVILSVRPGVFSLPKVWLRDQLPLHVTVLLDSYYVHRRTLPLDLRIIARGIYMVVLRRGVYS